jgi:hypothetical protein
MLLPFSCCGYGTNNVGALGFISLPSSGGIRIFSCYGLTDMAIPRQSPAFGANGFFYTPCRFLD